MIENRVCSHTLLHMRVGAVTETPSSCLITPPEVRGDTNPLFRTGYWSGRKLVRVKDRARIRIGLGLGLG